MRKIRDKRFKACSRRGIYALFPNNEEDRMPTLTKRELSVLSEANPDLSINLVELEHEGKRTDAVGRWWGMTVVMPGQEKVYEIVTALGKRKLFKHLDVAVDYVKESCPQTRTVCVVFAT